MPKNYYIILGIPSSSTQEDIKTAYRKLAKEFHPDHYGKNHLPFLNLQEAYSVLSDPARRRAYDDSFTKKRQKQASSRRPEPMAYRYREDIEPLIPEKNPVDLGDASLERDFHVHRPSLAALLDRLFNNFEERKQSKGERPENLTAVITITPEQAFRGGHVRLNIPSQIHCPTCNGTGGIGFYECWRCSGAGNITGVHPVLLSYPPGISDNHTVQVSLDRYGIRNLYLTVNFRISELG